MRNPLYGKKLVHPALLPGDLDVWKNSEKKVVTIGDLLFNNFDFVGFPCVRTPSGVSLIGRRRSIVLTPVEIKPTRDTGLEYVLANALFKELRNDVELPAFTLSGLQLVYRPAVAVSELRNITVMSVVGYGFFVTDGDFFVNRLNLPVIGLEYADA